MSLPQQRSSNKMNLKVQSERKYNNTETERTNAADRHSERGNTCCTHITVTYTCCAHITVTCDSSVISLYWLKSIVSSITRWTPYELCWGMSVYMCSHPLKYYICVICVHISNTSNINSDDIDVTLVCLKNDKCLKWDIFDLPWCL